METGSVVTLVGVSQLGKGRIRDHGDQWLVTTHHQTFTPATANRLLKSMLTGHERWVTPDDNDLSVA